MAHKPIQIGELPYVPTGMRTDLIRAACNIALLKRGIRSSDWMGRPKHFKKKLKR